MVEFFFNLWGYEFQSSLAAIRKSAQVGIAALNNEASSLAQELETYARAGIFEGEQDEDGRVVWSRDEILNYEIDRIHEALMEFRKAFAITAFHHWERSVQKWVFHKKTEDREISNAAKKGLSGFEKLSNAARNENYPIDAELYRVAKLTNTLKHNTENLGLELLKMWPDVFPPAFQRPQRLSDWASCVILSDHQLFTIFDIISRSGPTSGLP